MSLKALSFWSIRIVLLLCVIFVTLKCVGIIGWSWLWVFAPIWGPLAIGIAFVLVVIIVLTLSVIFRKNKSDYWLRKK